MKRMNFGKRLALLKEQLGDDKCWPWPGCVDPVTGYASTHWKTVNGKQIRATVHRMSYMLNVGEIPIGLVIDHKCRNRICVNPNHLEAVTQRENIARGENQRYKAFLAGTCTKGHKKKTREAVSCLL